VTEETTAMRTSGALSVLGGLLATSVEIPTVPAIAAQVIHAIESPELGADALAAIIEPDQGISARLLKTANSSLYGLSRRVHSLQSAVLLLGFAQVRDIVLASSTRHLYKRFGPVERGLWVHSVAMAVATRQIAMALAPAEKETAYLAGQMHDIGQVVMNNLHAEAFAEALLGAKTAGSCPAEQAVFGFSHADVGALLASRWRMPPAVEAACFYHHDLAKARSLAPEQGPLVACVVLANAACHELGFASEVAQQLFTSERDEALELLGASMREFEDIMEGLAVSLQEQVAG
jgi:HD-like signal output (HDOD) protein